MQGDRWGEQGKRQSGSCCMELLFPYGGLETVGKGQYLLHFDLHTAEFAGELKEMFGEGALWCKLSFTKSFIKKLMDTQVGGCVRVHITYHCDISRVSISVFLCAC